MEARYQQIRHQIGEIVGWTEVFFPQMHPESIGDFYQDNRRHDSKLCVLTGTPCAGKTAVLEKMKEAGVPTVPEFMRELGELADIDIHPKWVQSCIDIVIETAASRHIQAAVEHATKGESSHIFFDRGLGDSIGMLQALRFAVETPILKEIVKTVYNHQGYHIDSLDLYEIDRQIKILTSWAKVIRYDNVIWLDTLPHYEHDSLRPSTQMQNKTLGYFIKKSWHDLGYTPTERPPMWGDLNGRIELIKNVVRL